MNDIRFEIGNFTFRKSTTFIIKEGKIYRKAAAGLFPGNDWMRTTRIVNGYKIHADHFECALPYSNYYILDFKNECIYESKDNVTSRIQDLVEAMASVKNIEDCFKGVGNE